MDLAQGVPQLSSHRVHVPLFHVHAELGLCVYGAEVPSRQAPKHA